jgi:hypothetical protein
VAVYQHPLWVDYRKRVADLKLQRSENPYEFVEDPSVDERFWSRFHNDYYYSVLYQEGKCGTKAPLFPHKHVVIDSLHHHNHPEINDLVTKLDEWCLLPLMTFEKSWNEEIICQFWATLWIDADNEFYIG